MKTAWKHIRRTPYQALAAVMIMIQTFFIASILGILVYASSSTLHYYETRPPIIAYLKSGATPEQIATLQHRFEQDGRIKNLRYVSKEEALGLLKKLAENPLVTEFLSPTVLPADFEFSVTDLSYAEAVINEIKNEKIIDSVGYSLVLGNAESLSDTISKLQKITTYIRIGGATLVGFLLLSSFLTLLTIIGFRISARKEEVDVMQLIGATPGFIYKPFFLEGIFYTLLGAIIGWLLVLLIILYLSPALISYFHGVPFIPDTLPGLFGLFGVILGIELITAILVGLLGSFVAIKRYLKL